MFQNQIAILDKWFSECVPELAVFELAVFTVPCTFLKTGLIRWS